MTHAICSLLHWLAVFPGNEFHRISTPEHYEVLPFALDNRYVECPDPNNALDRYHLRLTPQGRELVAEGLNAMEAVS